MAWKFPKRRTRYDSPIDGEDLSGNFHEFISENGKLNEHNFSADSTLSENKVQIPFKSDEDAAVAVTSTYWTTSHKIGKIRNPGSYLDTGESSFGRDDYWVHDHDYIAPYGSRSSGTMNTLSAKSIKASPSWQRLKSIEGTTQNSTLWVISSFLFVQVNQPYNPVTEEYHNTGTFAKGNAQFALRLNGSIIWETATMAASEDDDPLANRELHGPSSLALDALVPVVAGPFTLELVGRCTHDDSYATPHVIEGDLIAMEFRR